MHNGTQCILILIWLSIANGKGGMGGGGRGGGGFGGGGRGGGSSGGGGRGGSYGGGGGRGGGGWGGGSRATATAIGFRGGGFIAVSSYRGDGRYSTRSSGCETINSSIIYSAIFKNASLFSSKLGNKRWISHPETPVNIKDDLIYFWDKEYLPPNTTNCSHYATSNVNKLVTFCKVNEMMRCARRIHLANDLQPFSFFTPNYTQLTSFAWVCPKGRVCCEWECCEMYRPPDRSPSVDPFIVIAISLLFFLVIATIAGLSDIRRTSSQPISTPQQIRPRSQSVRPRVMKRESHYVSLPRVQPTMTTTNNCNASIRLNIAPDTLLCPD